jgi:rRNA-processing protein EBP2
LKKFSIQPAVEMNDNEDDEDEEDDDEEEEDIPISDIESLDSDDKADIIPHQRLTINNTAALTAAYKSIAQPSNLPFSVHQTLSSATPVSIPDVNDDLNRELAFYKQCLDTVTEARTLLKKEGVPFTRPTDYFAEMVKSDEHMGKIKAKMTEDAAAKKASAEARKQRDLKKFGKQVQVAKLQERNKEKKDTLEKINLLKRSTIASILSLETLTNHSNREKGRRRPWCNRRRPL